MEKTSLKKNSLLQNLDEEINLNKLFRIILRNKKFIGTITFISFVLACIYSLTLKRVWEGQFEIVLESKNQTLKNLNIPQSLLNIAGISGDNTNNLMTEIGILESPSVLMPVFEFVKENQKPKNEDLIFSAWKGDSIFINLKEETSILNIAYRGTDKELILPILKKISKEYQKYSGRGKRRSQELSKKYLINQIEKYRINSSNSFKAAQEFAIDQDLATQSLGKTLNINNKSQETLPYGMNNFMPNIGIEVLRVEASNQISKIDSQLESIDDIENDFSKLQFLISTMNLSTSQYQNLLEDISELEKEIIIQSSKYTQNDPKLKYLINVKDLLIQDIKTKTKSVLKAQRMLAKSKMDAATRPKDVLIKYKELIREAERDEMTLVSLENQLMLVELNESREEDPWELITEPTLLERPVAPSRRVIGTIGLLLGFLFSFVISILKEKKSGTIFEIDDLEFILPYPLFRIDLSEENKSNKSLNLLKEYISKLKIKENPYFLHLGDINNQKKEFIKTQFVNNISIEDEKEIDLFTLNAQNFQEFIKAKEKFVLVSVGSTKYDEINDLKDRLELFNLKLSGVIVY